MEKLTKDDVLHVANLAKIKLSDSEIEKFQIDLEKLLDDVHKIKNIEDYSSDFMIAPWSHETELRKDEVKKEIDEKSLIDNAPVHTGNYIVVPSVISEGDE